MRNWFRALLLVLMAFAPSGQSLAGELFTDFNMSAEEQREFKRIKREQIENSEKALASLAQLQFMMMVMPLMEGNCDGIAKIDDGAKAGDKDSQTALALAYIEGQCVKKNISNGAKWLKKAANAGHAVAQEQLGLILLNGQGEIKATPQAAVRYVKMAAEQNTPTAQYLLAEMYNEGKGVPKDFESARLWYEKAANNNNEKAIYQLVGIYINGTGVAPNQEKALAWALFGAKQGSFRNQYVAAIILGNSDIQSDLIEAYKWANLSVSKSPNPEALNVTTKLLSKIEARLSTKDIAKAQGLSSSWEPDSTVLAPNIHIQPQSAVVERVNDTPNSSGQKTARDELFRRGISLNRIAFFKAIQTDDLPLVKLFIKAGASLEAVAIEVGDGPLGVTPIYVAVDWGAYKVFRHLMDQNIDINKSATQTGWTPLVRALSHDRLDMAKELLKRGADASQQTATGGDIIGDVLKTTALSYTLSQSDPELVRLVLSQGGSVHERYGLDGSDTPLLNAVKFGGSTEVMQVLLDAGADVNEGNKSGETPLMGCLQEDKVRLDAISFLLANKANPNKKMSAQSPLFKAVVRGHSAAIKLLVRNGAKINEQFHFKVSQIPMVFSDKKTRDILKNGGTPLQLAQALDHIGAAKTLRKLGAK